MNRFTIMLLAVVFAGYLSGCNNDNDRKPNIIFIFTDDQRWDAVGYTGNPIIKTPNMDELAGNGLYFQNAFVTTPICAASRATLFTGLYERTHDYTFGKPNLDNRYMYESYPYLLRKAGYRTGFVGKFGVKVNEGIIDSMFSVSKLTGFPYFKEVDGKRVHLADINGNHAIDFIKENKDQPFCLSLSFWSPHADDGAEEQYFWPEYCDSLYEDVEIPVPETADPAFFEALPEFLKTTMNRERWYWRYDTPEKYQKMVKGYYRMISGVDSVLARIQSTLKEEGLADNTVIMLMGDNGYFLGERGYAGKWLMYEQSIRVPLVIYDPRQPEPERGKTVNEMVLNVDVTPTILDLAGVDIPERYHGESLTAFYNGNPESWRSSIFCEHRLENNALLPKTECFRDDTWKFIRYEDNPDLIELYNFREDPQEKENLAYNSSYADRIEHYKNTCDSIADKFMSDRVKKPNVIFVLADQWRAQATGYNGDPNLVGKTPNLDQLADQGIHFTNAISVCPVCTPYRAALLTGQYPTTTGMFFNDLHLPDDAFTMAEMFRESGYQTGYIGKWHLDGMGRASFTPPERRQGFEYWKALECSHDYNQLLYYTGDSDEKHYWEGYGPYAETVDAISYFRQHAADNAPFLMVLAWGAPHFPHHTAPEELQESFPPEDIVLRDNVPDDMKESARKESVGYYAHILALDSCMGMLLQAMHDAGIAENTILVFTSDHGEMMGSQGVRPRQKQVPWAESVKVPLLLRYPERFGYKSRVVEAPINAPDILPTLLSLAGLPIPGSIEGEDMTAAIDGEKAFRNKAALIMNVSPFAGKADEYRGIYTSRYAYVNTLDGPWLLFDHQNDPLQMDNLAGRPEYEVLQAELEEKLQKEMEKIGDNFQPREYYIDQWGYELTEGGYIDYSEDAEFQGPGLNDRD